MQNVMIGWTDTETVHGVFAYSMLKMFIYETGHPKDNYRISRVMRAEGGWTGIGRDTMAHGLLESDDEWLLSIDTDESFEPNILEKLMETADAKERPIVTGLYGGFLSLPGIPDKVIADNIFTKAKESGYIPLLPDDDKTPFKVDAFGTGVYVIHRSVFERIPFPIYTYDVLPAKDGKPAQYGEDMSLCIKLEKAGIPIWCDPRVRVTHYKTFPVESMLATDFSPEDLKRWEEMAKKG